MNRLRSFDDGSKHGWENHSLLDYKQQILTSTVTIDQRLRAEMELFRQYQVAGFVPNTRL